MNAKIKSIKPYLLDGDALWIGAPNHDGIANVYLNTGTVYNSDRFPDISVLITKKHQYYKPIVTEILNSTDAFLTWVDIATYFFCRQLKALKKKYNTVGLSIDDISMIYALKLQKTIFDEKGVELQPNEEAKYRDLINNFLPKLETDFRKSAQKIHY